MKLLVLFSLVAISMVSGYHMVVGNIAYKVKIAQQEVVEYNAIPFIKRVKYHFISLPEPQKIQGIQALDNMQTKSSINITAGGVGYSYANLRLKSERGRGLSYNIAVYVNDSFV